MDTFQQAVFRLSAAGVVWLLLSTSLPGQSERIELKINGALQFQTETYKASEGSGYGGDLQFSYDLGRRFYGFFQVAVDQMGLTQRDVLDEWDWAYWEDTYIEFLPGADVEEVNRTLVYNSGDGIYSAVFEPGQNLREVRLAGGVDYRFRLKGRLEAYSGMGFGVSLYKRNLSMEEHWTKRFKLDTLSTGQFDYEYQYDLLHFAPAKSGARAFAAPALGLRLGLNDSFDLDIGGQLIYYFRRENFQAVDDLLGLSAADEQWFPLKSKAKISLGITFKY